jgi:flagellar basal body rod protein FlgF
MQPLSWSSSAAVQGSEQNCDQGTLQLSSRRALLQLEQVGWVELTTAAAAAAAAVAAAMQHRAAKGEVVVTERPVLTCGRYNKLVHPQ